MKGIRITLKPIVGWHIRNPATYRIERTYPVIPPTVLFGIVQNLFFTSSHKTPYRDIIALGGFPQTDIGLSLETQRIVKIKSIENIVIDRHEIEVAHSGPIDCYLLSKESARNDYVERLENTIGDIVLLTTAQFPAKIEDVSAYDAIKTKSASLLFSTSREGLGLPYVLPLRYEFKKKEDYRTQQYGRVLLPYSPVISNGIIKRTEVALNSEIDIIQIGEAKFDIGLVNLCENTWQKGIETLVGTI